MQGDEKKFAVVRNAEFDPVVPVERVPTPTEALPTPVERDMGMKRETADALREAGKSTQLPPRDQLADLNLTPAERKLASCLSAMTTMTLLTVAMMKAAGKDETMKLLRDVEAEFSRQLITEHRAIVAASRLPQTGSAA